MAGLRFMRGAQASHVAVSKPGYLPVGRGERLQSSEQGFDIAVDTGRGRHQPDSRNPVVFHLLRADNPVVLEKVNGRARIPQNGQAVSVGSIHTKRQYLIVSCKSEPHERSSIKPFD